MEANSANETLLRQYLLGETAPAAQQQIEEQLLRSDAVAEQLVLLEEELIDDYARGALPARELELFEQYFLTTDKRRNKLAAAQELVRYASQIENRDEAMLGNPASARPVLKQPVVHWWQGLFEPWWKVALATVLVLGAGIWGWRWWIAPTEIERGMLALNQAYQQQRPVKVRITGLAYAPFFEARGNDPERVELRARDRAERIFLDCVAESNLPAAHHALGRLYLTRRKFAQSLTEFELAVKGEPDNAQLHNDLGAALLEQSWQERDLTTRTLALGHALDELNRAVTLNPALLEAVFNRALCRQTLGLTAQAEAGWREYLQIDAVSPWAEEARQYLRDLEQQQKKAARSDGQIYEDFLAAYHTGDEAQAWQSLKVLRQRSGSALIRRLIDEWFDFTTSGQRSSAQAQIRLLDFAGMVERKYTSDRYTTELAGYYRQTASQHLATLRAARQAMKEAAALYDQSKLQAARALYQQAAALFQSAGDTCESYMAESWSGYCLMRMADTNEGLALFKRLQWFYQQRGYYSLEAYALESLADAYFVNDEFMQALECANQALQLAQTTEDWSCQLRSLSALAQIDRVLGRYEESLVLGGQGIVLATQQRAEPRQSWAFYSSAALNLLKFGYTHAALDVQREAQGLAGRTNWPLYQSLSVVRQGLLYAELGQPGLALRAADQALAVAQEITEPALRENTRADVLLARGQLLRRAGRMTEALASYEQARALYAGSAFQLFSYQAQIGCFLVRLALNDNTSAAHELTGILRLLEKYRGQILEESSRNAFLADEQEFYDAAITFASQHGEAASTAYQLAENSRARAWLDYRRRAPKVVRRGEALELHASALAEPLTLAEIQRRLPAHTQVLHFALLNQRLIGWVIRNDGFWVAEQTVPLTVLTSKAQQFVELLTRADPRVVQEVREQAEDLYRLLIQPLENRLRPQELLCIVPDKTLHLLPFAALRSKTRGKYLIEDYPLVLAPSSTAFVLCSELAATKQAQTEKLLCFGNPELTEAVRATFPDLPAAQNEAEQVAALYNTDTGSLRVGAQAKESLFTRLAGQVDVIHLASHGLSDARSPLLSRLFLAADATEGLTREAADGLLHAYEIYQLRLPRPRLVVLSACQTGVGQLAHGEGVQNLARPWLAAGVPVVVASLWRVDSTQTKELMVRFHYQRKRAGQAVAQALRASQLEMLAQPSSLSAHPSAWASFAVIGGASTY